MGTGRKGTWAVVAMFGNRNSQKHGSTSLVLCECVVVEGGGGGLVRYLIEWYPTNLNCQINNILNVMFNVYALFHAFSGFLSVHFVSVL